MQIATIAWYEVKRVLRDRMVLIIQFALPLVLIFLLGSALSGVFQEKDKKLKPIELAYASEDAGVMQEQFEAFLAASTKSEMLQPSQLPSRDQVVQRIKEGQAEFGLFIPSGFSQKTLQGNAASWELIPGKDHNQNLTAQMVLQSFLDQANSIQAVVTVAGPELLNSIRRGGMPNAQGQDASISEPAFVKLAKLSKSKAAYSATQYYAAAMLVMFLLYGGMVTALSLVTEKETHTLARLTSLPISSSRIITGKVFGSGMIALLQALIIIVTSKLWYGVDWGDSYLMLLTACLLVIVASMSLAILVALVAASSRAVITIFQTLIIMMTFLSGGFKPSLGEVIEKIGYFTVNHWAMQGMLHMMLGSDPAVIVHHLTILGGIGIGLLLVALAVYRKVGYHE